MRIFGNFALFFCVPNPDPSKIKRLTTNIVQLIKSQKYYCGGWKTLMDLKPGYRY